MSKDIVKKVKKFISNAFINNKNEIYHAKRTVYWIKKLKPNPNKMLIISGFSHDIERAFYGDWKNGSSDKNKLKKHEKLSAKIITDFLLEEKANNKLIHDVNRLVLHHEHGGKPDENILSDADCIAYLEEKGIRLAKTYLERKLTKKDVKKKIDYVFKRIHSKKGKMFAKKFYNKAIKELEKN